MTYNLHTSAWHQYGLTAIAVAPSSDAAKKLVERGLYARKDDLLRDRHDWAGDGFRVEIVGAALAPREGA